MAWGNPARHHPWLIAGPSLYGYFVVGLLGRLEGIISGIVDETVLHAFDW